LMMTLKKVKLKSNRKTTSIPAGVFVEEPCAICLCEFEEYHSHETDMMVEKLKLMNDHLRSGGDEDGLVKVLNCGHAFHPSCLDEWLSRRNVFPLCKRVPILI
jgi:hypothetical protein